jgi:uncharacterized protein (TIGR02466 family)
MRCNIIPLFPSIIFQSKLENNYDDIFEQFKQTNFVKNKHFLLEKNDNKCYHSSDYYILKNHKNLKNDILQCFNYFKNNIMHYENTDFQITTSWITKVDLNSVSHYHNHKNSFYSGVLYFDDLVDCGPIEFTNTNLTPQSFSVNLPTEYNIHNCSTWQIHPSKNNIIFFPSYLNHRVSLHLSDTPRYSLAFNLIPIGVFGNFDSTLAINIIE